MIGTKAFVIMLALLAAGAAHAQSTAQNFPTRPLRLIIPMGAGGATDIFIRTIVPKLSDILGQQVVVDNRPGANGVIGDEMAVKAAPDGYTLMANSIAITINPGLYKLSYDITRDLQGLTRLGMIDLLMGIHPSIPAKTVSELIAHAKANPGKLNYASFGIGSISHVAGEMFKQATSTQLVHVAYKTSPLAVQETIAGQTHLVMGGISYMLPQARAGRLRGIAITSLQRNANAPDIPTAHESGLPNFDVNAWFGIWVPAATPKPVVAKLYDAVSKTMNHPDVRPAIEKHGYKIGGESPEAFHKFVRSEVEKFGKVIKAAGIKAEG
ncbi:MAG: tripartite tricarboxylate transporter substrate binding protein [Burkholderiales bacterium]